MTTETGSRLREERERLGLSQAAFAEKMGVHRNTQVRYESGVRDPDTEYMERLSEIGVDFGYILFGKRSDSESLFGLAAARVLPGIAERVGICSEALIDLLHLAAEDEARTWGPSNTPERKGHIDYPALEDALFADGPLLAQMFYEMNRVAHEKSLNLPCTKKAQTVLMLFRTFKEAGQIDQKLVDAVVTLAAS